MTSKQLATIIKRSDKTFGEPIPKSLLPSNFINFRVDLEIAYQLALLNEKIAKGIGIRNA